MYKGLCVVEREYNESYRVTYKFYSNLGWCFSTVTLDSELELKEYLDQFKKDFNKRLVGVEKRLFEYERYEVEGC